MREVIRAFWPTILRFRWWFVAFVVTMGLNTVCKTVYPYFLRRLTDYLTAKHYDDARQTFCIVAALVILDILVWALMDICLANFQVNGIADLDRRSFRAIQMQSVKFMESWHSGALASAAKRFKNAFEYITDFLNTLVGSIAMILIAIAVFALERPMFAVAFGVWAIFFFAVSYWFASMRMKRSIEIAKKDSKAGGAFGDSLANYMVVTSFAMESFEQEHFNKANEDLRAYRLRSYGFTDRCFGAFKRFSPR